MTHPDIRDADLVWLAGLAHALVREPHAADDLVQDTVLAAARTPGPLHQPRAFLAAVARKLSARRARTESRRRRRERIAAQDELALDSTELVERAELAELVARAARDLDEPFRTTVLAHYLDGASVAEIAKREGRPADTIRWRLRQGLDRLRTKLVQDHGRDWSQWCVLLLPLARAHVRTAAGLTAAAGAGSSTTTTALIFMKSQVILATTAALLVAACAIFWLEWPSRVAPTAPTAEPEQAARATAVARSTSSPLAETRDAPTPPTPGTRTEARSATGAVERAAARPGWSVLVVDPDRRPIAGASVDLVEIRPADDEDESRPRVHWHGTESSDDDGIAHFDKLPNAERFGIIADADGWLRSAVPPPTALPDDPASPLVVVLRPGSTLRGRVVDRSGNPVPDLELFTVTTGHAVDHVCISSTALRAQTRFRDPRNADYQQSIASTAADGTVSFSGVPARTGLAVRSTDPGWQIVDSESVDGDAPFVTWIAARTLGVEVRVLDSLARRPVPASGTFNVELELADGTREPVGQWVGKGIGSLRFAFHEELFPPLAEMDVVRATFHGTVTTKAGTETWRSTPILLTARRRVAELDVLVAASALADEPPASTTPSVPLVLDVVDGLGLPYGEPLLIGWSSTTSAGNPEGDVRATMVTPGTYRAMVPVPGDIDDIELTVQPRFASRTVTPWKATVPAKPDEQQVLSVRLPSAGGVVILRPRGWTTAWDVRAQYRDGPNDEWRGAWTYGTRDDRLMLNALRPAEWRFELSQDAPARETTLTVVVPPGAQQIIGG